MKNNPNKLKLPILLAVHYEVAHNGLNNHLP